MFASLQNPAHSQTSTAFAPDEELAAACLRWWNIALVREKYRLSGIAERLKADPDMATSSVDRPDDTAITPLAEQEVLGDADIDDDYE